MNNQTAFRRTEIFVKTEEETDLNSLNASSIKFPQIIDDNNILSDRLDGEVSCLNNAENYRNSDETDFTNIEVKNSSFCDNGTADVLIVGKEKDDEKRSSTNSSKVFICNYCQKVCTQKVSLQSHIRIHTGEKPYHCMYCMKNFSDRSNLVRHLRRHKNEKRFVCTVCDKPFSRKEHLQYHMRTHTGERPFGCNQCTKRFGLKSTLLKHLRTHTGERPFMCNWCGKQFSRRDPLKIHLRTHVEKKLEAVANELGIVASSEVKNIRSPLPLSPYLDVSNSLPVSELTADTRKDYNKELFRFYLELARINDPIDNERRKEQANRLRKQKRYTCHYCGKSLSEKKSVRDHIRIHTGEKPFRCVYCQKRFTSHSNLTRHMITHNGEKRYKCVLCGKMFQRTERLKIHMRTHTGERPYACNYCEKRFGEKGTLKKHLILHTGEKPFPCHGCHRWFYNKSTLNKHIVQVHK